MNDDWRLFRGEPEPHDGILRLPPPPSWRTFARDAAASRPDPADLRPLDPASRDARRGRSYRVGPRRAGPDGVGAPRPDAEHPIEMINAALYLRRPLLITGKPGTGKSSLAYAVAHELKLGPVLHWPITSRSTLAQGLYRYDAIGRLQDAQLRRRRPADVNSEIGRFIQLGPLGTALLASTVPRVLLIDEIDKSDIDLPNDLLNVLEEGEFEIPELSRLPGKEPVRVSTHYARRGAGEPPADPANPAEAGRDLTTEEVVSGRVRCREFPFVVMTNNGERDFPAPFLRRCLRLELSQPDDARLAEIVEAHFEHELRTRPEEAVGFAEIQAESEDLIGKFLGRQGKEDLATDQLLNALYLLTRRPGPDEKDKPALIAALMRSLGRGGSS